MPPSVGDTRLTVVVGSRAGRVPLLRDGLYSLVAQSSEPARALVVVNCRDSMPPAEVTCVLGRLHGLLDADVIGVSEATTLGAAFNAALDAVTTPFCSFLADTELLYPRYARLLGDALHADARAVAAIGAGHRVTGRLTEDGFLADSKVRWRPPIAAVDRRPAETPLALCATVVRVASVRDAELRFDERPGVDPGPGFLQSLAALGPMISVDVPVCEQRVERATPAMFPHPSRTPDSDSAAAVLVGGGVGGLAAAGAGDGAIHHRSVVQLPVVNPGAGVSTHPNHARLRACAGWLRQSSRQVLARTRRSPD